MVKKLLWASGIFLALVLILLLGLSLLVKSYLKSERLKSIIIPKAEEATGRKVGIDEIYVSLFKGIVIKGISLKEHDGNRDFIKTKEFILDYSLRPLLKKQLVIKKIEIISPYIHIRRGRDGRYNFSDITEKVTDQKKGLSEPEGKKEKGLPFSVLTDRIYIRDARVEFADDTKTLPDITADADIEIMASLGRDTKDMKASGHLDLRGMKATVEGLETNTTGRIEMNSEAITINLNTVLGKESIKLSGNVKDYLKSPDITLNLYARELSIDRLIPQHSGKKTDKESPIGKSSVSGKERKEQGEKTGKIKASGEIKIDAAHYKDYNIKNFQMNYRYVDGFMTIEPLRMYLAGGGQVKAEGILKGSMQFNYGFKGTDTVSDIKRTLTGKGVLDLSRCEIKSSKIIDAIALFTGLGDIRSPQFESSQFHFSIRDQKVYFDGILNSSQLKLNPAGSAGFDERIDMITDLKVSPGLASRLPTAKITGYMKDEKGWSVIPLKITGTIEKPSVSLNSAAIGKQIEKGIKGEIEKRLFKGTLQKKGDQQPPKQQRPQDLLKGIFGR